MVHAQREDEMDIKEQLDQLAEFQAQATLIELDKRKLLDEVKIPADVLSTQDEANKLRLASDAANVRLVAALNAKRREEIAAVPDPEMPAEFVAALAAARAKREEIQQEYDRQADKADQENAQRKAQIEADMRAAVSDVYARVAQRKNEILAEFAGKEEAVKSNIDKLTAEIKEAVKAAKESVKGQFYHAIYMNGRVSWNTDMLDGMVVAFPALAKARKEGEPSVTIRKIG